MQRNPHSAVDKAISTTLRSYPNIEALTLRVVLRALKSQRLRRLDPIALAISQARYATTPRDRVRMQRSRAGASTEMSRRIPSTNVFKLPLSLLQLATVVSIWQRGSIIETRHGPI